MRQSLVASKVVPTGHSAFFPEGVPFETGLQSRFLWNCIPSVPGAAAVPVCQPYPSIL